MKRGKGVGIGVKTTLTSIMILVGVSVLGIFLAVNIYTMKQNMIRIKDKQVNEMIKSLELADEIGNMQLTLERYIAGDGEQEYNFNKYYQAFEAEFSVLEQMAQDNLDDEDVQKLKNYKKQYYDEAQNIFGMYKPKNEIEANLNIQQLVKNESEHLEEAVELLRETMTKQAADESRVDTLKEDYIPSFILLGDLIDEAGDLEANLQAYMAGSPTVVEDFAEDSASFKESYALIGRYIKEENRAEYESIGTLYSQLDTRANTIFATYNPQDKAEAIKRIGIMYSELYQMINETASNITYTTKENVVVVLEEEIRVIEFMLLALIVGASVVGGLVVLSTFIIHKTVILPITQLSQTMKDIGEGEGNLTVRIPVKSKDEIGILIHYFNQFVEKIQGMIQNVLHDTNTLFESASQMDATIQNAEEAMGKIGENVEHMTYTLQENASTVEETTASIQEIASGASVVSEKTEEVASSSGDVLFAAKEGARKLEQVREGFQEVQQASDSIQDHLQGLITYSKDIGQVLQLITGVSDQVNLLALNASIEAARAGEYGLGFAVVADEIRKLAEESRLSAIKIGDILGQVATKTKEVSIAVDKEHGYIEESSKLMTDTEVAFSKIVTTVEQVTKQMNNIAEVIDNQSHATDEISQAINEVSVSTQSNAESVVKINGYVNTQVELLKTIGDRMTAFNQLFANLIQETNKFKV